MDDTQMLERYLLTGTPQEAAEFFEKHRGDVSPGRALAIACRFCGIEHVRALVESGAVFKEPGEIFPSYYWFSLLNLNDELRESFLYDNDNGNFGIEIERTRIDGNSVETFYILPEEQRAEIAKYLCENSDRVNLKPGELLFFSIMSNSRIIAARLREMGVTFMDGRKHSLTHFGGYIWFDEFISALTAVGDDIFADVIREVVKEVGGQRLCYLKRSSFVDDSLFDDIEIRFFRPGFFVVFLKNFRFNKESREELLRNLIAKNKPELLAQCAKCGWLRKPEIRDEMIAYASEVKSTECLAWLLDYKNRSFDLAAERAKAEKKEAHELNAPLSIAALQKNWHWKKQADGTLIITGHWGSDEVVNVPPKIGRRAVTAIDEGVLSCGNMRKAVIPCGIRSIGSKAFLSCKSLEEVIIPDSVVEIGVRAFYNCKRLAEITIPGSVKKIGKSAFSRASLQRAFVEPGSCAEEFCKQNKIPYEYIKEEA